MCIRDRGDTINAGDPVVEVQIDKAVAEIECPHGGTIEKVHVAEGDTIKVGAVLVSVSGEASGNSPAAPAKPAPAAAASPAAPATPAPASEPAAAVGGSAGFLLPSPGENPAEVVEVMVKEGDMIEEDDIVCLVQTEKAVAELESPYTGKITKLNIKESDFVEEGHVLITVELTAAPKAAAASAAQAAPTKPAATSAPAARVSTAPSARDNRPPAPAGPATRRLARKMGVDLHAINGTGPGGRITQEDLEAHVKRRLESGGGGGVAAPPLPDFTKWGEVERQPMNAIAKASAKNLSVAWTNIPHVTQHDMADITELEAACLLYTSPSPRDRTRSRMPSSA